MKQYRKFSDVLIEDLKNDLEYRYTYLQVALEEFQEEGDTLVSAKTGKRKSTHNKGAKINN